MTQVDLWTLENELRTPDTDPLCGVDEAGRGPLAGPVCAAAVILPRGLDIPGLNDSKKLSEKKREALYDTIRAQALSYGIAFATVEEIEEYNILGATFLAMNRAIAQLTPQPALALIDGNLGRMDAAILGAVFAVLMGWSIWAGMNGKGDALDTDTEEDIVSEGMSLKSAILWLIVGLVLLIGASRLLVWGAVTIAQGFGISDLVIGLTIVAVGTSLPELASSLIAIRKNEHDLALGNVLGSNLFNTLAVVGIAAGIHPLEVAPEVLSRDWSIMMGLTLLLLVMCLGRKGQGRINRLEGGVLLACFVAYTGWLLTSQFI